MIAVINEKPVSIGTAAKVTNTTVKKLRHWEEKRFINRNGFIQDHVASGGTYPEDLEKITRIKNYIDQGYTLHGAAQMADVENSNSRRK